MDPVEEPAPDAVSEMPPAEHETEREEDERRIRASLIMDLDADERSRLLEVPAIGHNGKLPA